MWSFKTGGSTYYLSDDGKTLYLLTTGEDNQELYEAKI